MDRRAFIAGAVAAVTLPQSVAVAGPVVETYATCPAGFALRSWTGEDGRSYRAVVPVQRYGDEGGCRWTRYVKSGEQDND